MADPETTECRMCAGTGYGGVCWHCGGSGRVHAQIDCAHEQWVTTDNGERCQGCGSLRSPSLDPIDAEHVSADSIAGDYAAIARRAKEIANGE